MITIREFRYSDLPDIIRIWNRCFVQNPTNEQDIAQILFANENYTPSNFLVAEQEFHVSGFLIGIRRHYPYLNRGLEADKAWILAMAVEPEHQHQAIGSELLHTLENSWYSSGIRHITLCTFSPYYFFPGIREDNSIAACFFQKHGFQQGSAAYWMERSLANFSIPQKIQALKQEKENAGYSYRSFVWSDAAPLLDFAQKNFSVGWIFHIRQAILNGQAPDIVQLCFFQDQIVGYLQRKMDGNPYRLGPFGVADSHRNGGVGTVLLYQMWESMHLSGLDFVFFQSTDEPGRRFYERQGMTVNHVSYHYDKC